MKSWVTTSLAMLAAASSALAASRASANYNVPADTVDAGGRRASSAAYTVDSSIGGIGGVSVAPAPAQSVRHSYVGQLFDSRAVVVTATPVTVVEENTRQLRASIAYDDATSDDLSASQVAWSVVTGPITSVNSTGLATAGTVFADTIGTVRGDYSGQFGLLNLTILNSNPDNYGLYANDGADDAWQVQYFGEENPLGVGGADPDGDGQTNYFEYVATTIPTNAASRFRLNIETVSEEPTRRAIRFSPRSGSRGYDVQSRTTVDAPGWTSVTGPITDNGSERTVTDTNATPTTRFYKVQITIP